MSSERALQDVALAREARVNVIQDFQGYVSPHFSNSYPDSDPEFTDAGR